MKKIYPKHYEIRIVKKFAFLPITITHYGIRKEKRWFETVHIKQHYVITHSGSYWKNVEFID